MDSPCQLAVLYDNGCDIEIVDPDVVHLARTTKICVTLFLTALGSFQASRCDHIGCALHLLHAQGMGVARVG